MTRILISEDSPTTRRMLEHNLTQWGFDVVSTENGKEAWDILQGDNPPQLAVIDWLMPVMDGLEVCENLRKLKLDRYVYAIILTGKTQTEDVVKGLESGADDYLKKPFSVEELRARLLVGKRIIELHNRLQDLAMRDSLTGLWNHQAILKILNNEMERWKRLGEYLAVCMLDLDYFKQVNDTYGHPVGDKTLCECARRIEKLIRAYDSVGRYGGEEFLIVVPNGRLMDSIKQADRLLAEFRNRPFQCGEHTFYITVSIGIAITGGKYERSEQELIIEADQALYCAKEKGRNRFEVANNGETVFVENYERLK